MRVPPSNHRLPRCSQVWAVRENVSELVLGKSATYLPNGGFYQLTAALVAVAYGLSVVVPSGAHSCLPVRQHLLRALHRTLLTLLPCSVRCAVFPLTRQRTSAVLALPLWALPSVSC